MHVREIGRAGEATMPVATAKAERSEDLQALSGWLSAHDVPEDLWDTFLAAAIAGYRRSLTLSSSR